MIRDFGGKSWGQHIVIILLIVYAKQDIILRNIAKLIKS